VKDNFNSLHSVIGYEFNHGRSIKLTNMYCKANQNFDHLYAGNYCNLDGKLSDGNLCNYKGKLKFRRAWQETSNKTYSYTLYLIGKFDTSSIAHDILIDVEYNIGKRGHD